MTILTHRRYMKFLQVKCMMSMPCFQIDSPNTIQRKGKCYKILVNVDSTLMFVGLFFSFYKISHNAVT